MIDEKIKQLIAQIDHFHGNELKDRDSESVSREVKVVKEWLAQNMGIL